MTIGLSALLAVLFAIFLEIYLLFVIGASLGGLLVTVFIVVFTSVLGYLLIKQQTTNTLSSVQKSLMRGETPKISLVEAGVVMLGGVFLMIPGFITDTMGLLTLIPPFRKLMAQRMLAQVMRKAGAAMHAAADMHNSEPASESPQSEEKNKESSGSSHTIEGEYKRED